MKILNLCETARGGVGMYLTLLAKMSASGVSHRVIALSQHAGFLDPAVKPRTYDNPCRGPGSILSVLKVFLSERRQNAPDIYLFHSTFALTGLVMPRLLVRLVEGRLCGLADFVLNVLHADKTLAERYGYRGRHLVIEKGVADVAGGVQSDLFQCDTGLINLIFIGGLDRQKDLDLLLPAFAKAHAENPKLRLHVIGAPVRDAEQLPTAPEGVTISGWVRPEDIDALYASADEMVVPSR